MLAAGGKVATIIDLSDITMTLFLPETQAGRVPPGGEARLVLRADPRSGLIDS